MMLAADRVPIRLNLFMAMNIIIPNAAPGRDIFERVNKKVPSL